MAKVRDYLVLLGIAGLVIALDQWAKYLVRLNLETGETWSPFEWLSPYARIIHWKNTGAAFGLFQSGGLLFTVIAILVSIAILYYYPRVPSSQVALRFALALQLGGAGGNLIDRLIHGIVTDFISVGSFPVFNVADACISIGTAILIAAMWVEERRARVQGVEDLAVGMGDEEEAKERESPAG
ncbi:MAG TPA: signal peptidase II [Anaerolineae bacterium]|nr:signal peptidase II [Anaerolineae bacterium]